MFSRISSSMVCTCLSFTGNVIGNHDTSAKCLPCAFRFYFSVDAYKLRIGLHCCIFLVHLFCCISFLSIMLSPTWANQCTGGCIGNITSRKQVHALFSLGVGVVFAFAFMFFFHLFTFLSFYFCPFLSCLFSCLLNRMISFP